MILDQKFGNKYTFLYFQLCYCSYKYIKFRFFLQKQTNILYKLLNVILMSSEILPIAIRVISRYNEISNSLYLLGVSYFIFH
jgi:hypothetical protein